GNCPMSGRRLPWERPRLALATCARTRPVDQTPSRTTPGPPEPGDSGLWRALGNAIQTRIFGGLVLALPIALTFWIIYQLLSTLKGILLDPIALLIDQLAFTGRARDHLPDWWDRVVAPLISLCLVLTILYFLGYFVRTRIARLLDWSMSRVPGVTIVY